jgi:hypothetical protein
MLKHILLCLVCLAVPSYSTEGDPTYSLVVESKHEFSSSLHEDKFSLQVTGSSIFDATVVFSIRSWMGKEIYSDTFTVDYMMERDPRDPKTPVDSLNILSHLRHFFDDENFSTPAIKDTTGYAEENMISQDTWLEIWPDKGSVGFWFQLGAEDGRAIAFSKKSRRVVQYYGCC